MASSDSKKILIVPLDWGLGHTTRCIPIIKVLIELGHEVHIGGTDITNSLLGSEFPDLAFHSFPSYSITYPKNGKQFLNHILKLTPGIAKTVREERKRTQSLQKRYGFDIILSDNRFGVRNKNCRNIFISHQLNLSVPQSKIAERCANWINSYFINKYDRVGVPDWESQILSGCLSNKTKIRSEVIYLGSLSRWHQKELPNKRRFDLLVLLSGPEPQRSLLENLIIAQAQELTIKLAIVRAKPKEKDVPKHEGITFYNHLSADKLQELAKQSEIIISRAGYTTIMDLLAINKHAILIPTPGQTEQEYLAEHLNKLNLFTFYNQDALEVSKAILEFKCKTWGGFPKNENKLKEKVQELIA